jgi:beta-ureidopropionase
MPFIFCTREKAWTEFAEDVQTGRTVQWARCKAQQYGMVIILPILERDALMDIIWNTAVCIGHQGNVVGWSRKFHIPRVGDFNESSYYYEGNTGWPVFATKFGKIGVPICYSRHFPNTYLAHALSGAEILVNPSATTAGLSEPLWWTEQAANAVATSTFVGQINRVGTETMPHEFTSGDGCPAHQDFGHFYGTTMLTLPDGSRTPPLSRTRNGLLVAEVDLNLQQVTRDNWFSAPNTTLQTWVE